MVKCWSSIHWVCFAIWWERQHCRLVAKAMICNDFRKLYNHLSSTLVFETDTLLALLTICEFSHLEHQVNNCVIRRIWVGLIPDQHSKATYSAEDYSACCKDSYVLMLTPWQCMFWSSSPAWQPILRSGRSSLWSVVVSQAQNGEVVLTCCFDLKNLAMSNVVAKKTTRQSKHTESIRKMNWGQRQPSPPPHHLLHVLALKVIRIKQLRTLKMSQKKYPWTTLHVKVKF